MRIILDAKYKQADLKKVMTKKCQHLSPSEQNIILNVKKNWIFVQWNSRHMEYRPSGLGIKGLCEAIVLATLSST